MSRIRIELPERRGLFLERAPKRTDMAIAYLSWLLRRGEEAKILESLKIEARRWQKA